MVSPNPANLVVTFRTQTIPNEAESRLKGRPIFTDMEVCEIRFPGDKQKVAVFPAHEVEPNATRLAGDERFPYAGFAAGTQITYAMLYNDQYRAFKNGTTQAQSGTPVEELAFLTQAKRRELKALNVHTAEALAALDGNNLKQIGPGGRELKDKARLYLDNAAGTADVTALVDEVSALRAQLAEEREFREKFTTTAFSREQKNEEKRIAKEAADAAVAPGKKEAARKKAVAKEDAKHAKATEKAERGQVTASTDFGKWSREQLIEYVTQETGQKPKGNPSNATLISAAEELRGGK